MKSIMASLSTQDFWRVRCGVGRPPGGMDPADFVLRPFSVGQRQEADLMTQRAADLVEVFVLEGGDAASQRAGELNALE